MVNAVGACKEIAIKNTTAIRDTLAIESVSVGRNIFRLVVFINANVRNVHSTLTKATTPIANGNMWNGSAHVRSWNQSNPSLYKVGSSGLFRRLSQVSHPLKFLNVKDIHTQRGICAAGRNIFL